MARKPRKKSNETEPLPPQPPNPALLLLIAIYMESQALRSMILGSDTGIQQAQQLGESAQALAGPVIRDVLGLPPLEAESEAEVPAG